MLDSFLRILAWCGRFLVLAIGVAALVAALFGLAQLLGDKPEIPAQAGRSWIIAVSLVVAIMLLWGLWSMVRRVLLAPFGAQSVFGASPAARLLGLGVASLMFPRAVAALVVAPLGLLIDLFRGLPDRVASIVNRQFSIGATDSVLPADATLLRLVDLLQMVGGEIARSISNMLSQLPLSEIVLALALWALAGQLLSSTAGGQGTQADGAQRNSGTLRLVAYLRRLSTGQQYALGLGAVFLIGGFLSTASIVAIPWLQDERVPATLSAENLKKALDASLAKAEDIERMVPPDLIKRASPLTALQAVLDAPKPAAAQPASGAERPAERSVDASGAMPASMLLIVQETLKPSLKVAAAERDRALARAASLGKAMLAQQERTAQAGLRAFEAELGLPMSSQERLYFFKDIQRTVVDTLAAQLRNLNECKNSLDSLDARGEMISHDLAGSLNRTTDLRDTRVWDGLSELSRLASGYARSCSEPTMISTEFTAPDPGAGWGPFGAIANWLLRTKSMALTLITGMLGFGLLGAAISTFVRTDIKAPERPALEEVGRVVVRGLSAAVVVFLAVKGGLAVFTTGESAPNAYVLFFTCMVGAVFSEDVWRWAHNKLGGITPGDTSGKAAAAPKKDTAS